LITWAGIRTVYAYFAWHSTSSTAYSSVYTNLSKVVQQIGWVLIDTIGADLLQPFFSITSRQQAASKTPCSAGCEKILYAVPNHHGSCNRNIEVLNRRNSSILVAATNVTSQFDVHSECYVPWIH
jgi:hypothetical protein